MQLNEQNRKLLRDASEQLLSTDKVPEEISPLVNQYQNVFTRMITEQSGDVIEFLERGLRGEEAHEYIRSRMTLEELIGESDAYLKSLRNLSEKRAQDFNIQRTLINATFNTGLKVLLTSLL